METYMYGVLTGLGVSALALIAVWPNYRFSIVQRVTVSNKLKESK